MGAAFSVQFGAALATTAFDEAGPLGFVWLRVGLAAMLLLALNAPSLRRTRRLPLRWVLATGVAVAFMNACFYQAIDRIPLGLATTVEFLGPLTVAVIGSRRRLDFLWIALAGAGVALLGTPTVDLDPIGLAFAFGAAVGWASYILLAKRMLADWSVGTGLSLTLLVAALVLAPVALAADGGNLLDWSVLGIGLAVAVLGSVLPFTFELAALRQLSAATFGIVLSLEPAVAAFAGALALGQVPNAVEALAILLVIAASVGASLGARRTVPPEL